MFPRDPLVQFRDIPRALTLLTRLRVPGSDGSRAAAAAWAWPLVGVVIGLLAGAVATLALTVGLPAPVAAGFALAVSVVVMGGLHEDGLADCADGFWGGATVTRRLEIMKDSRIGSYGVLALILSVGLHWTLLAALIEAGLLWPAVLLPMVLGRAAMAAVMAALPFARDDGFARHVGRPRPATAALAAGLAIAVAAVVVPLAALPVALAAGLAGLGCAALARRKLGGQTGDVLGATQHMASLASLTVLLAVTDSAP